MITVKSKIQNSKSEGNLSVHVKGRYNMENILFREERGMK